MPFPEQLLEAVAGCTRALAGSDMADVSALSRANAATIGSLRAYADRLALRERFHDPLVHRQHLPADARAREVFAALEQARLDALGVRWMTGIARNLLAHPGREQDGVRWLAFAVFSLEQPPPEKATLAGQARSALSAALVAALTPLAEHIDNQSAFSAAAAAWAADAAPRLPQTIPTGARGDAFPLPRRVNIQQRRRRGDTGGTSAPLLKRATELGADDASTSVDGVEREVSGDAAGYHAYTTAHDRVVNAASVASRAELASLRTVLEKELQAIRPLVSRLAKRLLRVLMAQQTREWRFDLEEGLLDASRLAPFIASGGRARLFKEESDSPFPSTVVTLLIDHSGSMRGRPMQIAALTVEIFVRVLERCGVACEVLGFTTRDWDGGAPARQWAADGYPAQPGRLNALEHIVIKSADVPWRRARVGLGLCLRDEVLKENIDGEALAWAHGRLLARSEKRRILVVISDGTPMDEATFAANGFEYLDTHLAMVVERIERTSPVQLAAIGIGHDVSRFYGNATKIARVDDLGPALGQKLMTLLAAQR